MQQLILSHQSALAAIRLIRIDSNLCFIANEINTVTELMRLLQLNKLDILINNKNSLSKSRRKKYHLNSEKLPKGSIITINSNLKISSPQYLLMQLSNILNFEELSLLIMEMCGTYSINPTTHSIDKGLYPLTSISEIKAYINRFKKMNPYAKGIKKITQICNFAKNNSASPMESRLFIKLCGPKTKGFYGCKNLKLNKAIKVSKKAQQIAGQPYIIPDISCVGKKVAIEYDSAQFHENSIQGQRDKRRRDALVHDGWKVYTFVPSQINNPQTFNTIALDIKKSLNEEPQIRIKNFEQKRNRAFNNLI